MKNSVWALLTSLITFTSACHQPNKKIVQEADYAPYLDATRLNQEIKAAENEISFWKNRLPSDTGSFVIMEEWARRELNLFQLKGDITALVRADSLLRESAARLNNTQPELLFALAQTAVSRHAFRQSEDYINAAARANGADYTLRLLRFDTYMELGKYSDAWKSLQSLRDRASFDYLVRLAKWKDHQGDIAAAINCMEMARATVKDTKSSRYNWVQSNLGDMYGHAGRVEESYNAYLDVLKKDPANLYCLRGIAWIAWSHDHDAGKAKQILSFILAHNNLPDCKLVLAAIAESEGNAAEKNKWISSYLTQVRNPACGYMYTKYLVQVYNDETDQYQEALALATEEVNRRYTPETCSWLAWSYARCGKTAAAVQLVNSMVMGKTAEPSAQYAMAEVFRLAGDPAKARELYQHCLDASYELGPAVTARVQKALQLL